MATKTQHYGFWKPTRSGDTNTWGVYLDLNAEMFDALLRVREIEIDDLRRRVELLGSRVAELAARIEPPDDESPEGDG